MFLSLFSWFLVGIPIYNCNVILANAEDYRPAVFHVKKLWFYHDEGDDDSSVRTVYYAEGTIDGTEEKYDLRGELDRYPDSLKDLEGMVEVGASFDVWYNTGLTRAMHDGETVRVLKYSKDTFAKKRKLRRDMLVVGVSPMLITLVVFGTILCIKKLMGGSEEDGQPQSE